MSRSTVVYNGITLEYIRFRESIDVVYDEGGRTQKYVILTVVIQGIVTHGRGNDKAITRSGLINDLSVPGKQLTYTEDGATIISIIPVNRTTTGIANEYQDVLYGPKPSKVQILDNWPLATRVQFTITTTLSPTTYFNSIQFTDGLPNNITKTVVNYGQGSENASDIIAFNNSLLSHTIGTQYDIDKNHRTTRTITGVITIIGSYGTWGSFDWNVDQYRFIALNSSRFLNKSILRPPSNFERIKETYSPQPDGVTLQYQIVDTEVDWLPPHPATDGDMQMSIRDEEMQLGSVDKFIKCTFTLPSGRDTIMHTKESTFDSVVRIMRDVYINYVLSDPEAKVWVINSTFTRESWKYNIWSLEIHCLHLRSQLYASDSFQKIGLFAPGLNTTSKYNYPMPYGSAGLIGDGYNADVSEDLSNVGDYGNIGITNDLPGGSGGLSGGSLSEPEVCMFNETVKVVIVSQNGVWSTSSGIAAVAGCGGSDTLHIIWAGWKYAIDKKPNAVIASTKFKLYDAMTPTDTETSLPMGTPISEGQPAQLPAVDLLGPHASDEVAAQTDKITGKQLYGIRYRGHVVVAKWVVDKLKDALVAGTDYSEYASWPATLDGVTQKIAKLVSTQDKSSAEPPPEQLDPGDGSQDGTTVPTNGVDQQ